ncbi:MAG: sugar ABC transporter ATP-binding protein [Pirellulaceae bacterium]|nr:sugar ABC transporter ATP-binding protein [Pirellulaceae bacterium]
MVLRLNHISKSFGVVRALQDVSLEVAAREVHALVGENGAGKSTLIKIVTGAYRPDAGEIYLGGSRVSQFDPIVSKQLGVAVVYQQPTLFPDLSVAENLAYGCEGDTGWRLINWNARRRLATQLLARVGAEISPDTLARDLSMPQQQLVEIARAIGQKAQLVIMDEPTASLNTREVEHLLGVIKELRANGLGILYVTHRLEELTQIAQRVTVLRDGTWIATRPSNEISPAELIRLMVGRDVSTIFPKTTVPIGKPRLRVEQLSSSTVGIHDVSFHVSAGEILGIGGLMGAGRTELAQALFGLVPTDSGAVLIDEQPVTLDSPGQAISQGLAYVPEDRRRHGVIPEMPIAANVTLSLLDAAPASARSGLISGAASDRSLIKGRWGIDFQNEQQMAVQAIEQLQIKTSSAQAKVESLSGGNQQKVALGRWLAIGPRILILDEPTQGIDVGAKSEIYRVMTELAGQGMAIVLISSEIQELLGMCDRITVMRSGTISGTLDRSQATAEQIMHLALPDA